MAAAPITADTATNATPNTSPSIIHRVRRNPTFNPKVIANVIHIPGVIEIKNIVGIKTASVAIVGIWDESGEKLEVSYNLKGILGMV